MSQIDFINQIAKLHRENPNLEIRFFVRGDETLEFGYTSQSITRVEIHYWYPCGEQILTEEDEIRDQLFYEISEDKSLSENEIDNIVENMMASIPKAIVAYMRA